MTSTVRNIRDGGFDPANPDHVYIGRAMRFHKTDAIRTGSKWANPKRLRKGSTARERVAAIEWFRDEYLPTSPALMDAIPELRGKTLYCWCTPDRCHGDVLALLTNQPDDTLAALRVAHRLHGATA